MSTKIEWNRPIREGFYTHYYTKCQRGMILRDGGESPAMYFVFIRGPEGDYDLGQGSAAPADDLPPSSSEMTYHEDWRTLKDVKRAVEKHLQEEFA